MLTRQDILVKRLQEHGGEGTSLEMREILDAHPRTINDWAYHLRRRGLIIIVNVPIDHPPGRINKFILTEKGKNKKFNE